MRSRTNSLNRPLAVLSGIVLTVLAAAVWRGLVDPPPAYGQVPDSGKQREIMIREMQTQSERLAEIAGLLREIRDRQPAPPKDK